jgi:MFS family permease
MDRDLRRNFIVNVLDGGFFWFAYSFIAPAVILPLYVSRLTDSKLAIGLIAVLGATGYFFPQLFTSNWVERMAVKKDLPVKLGFFTERVPMLLLPLSVLLAVPQPGLALGALMLLFGWHSFGAGIIAVGWNSMIGKIFPVRIRGTFMGLATFTGNLTGIAGAFVAAQFLDRLAFPYGYMACFAVGGLMILISWFFLALTREPPDEINPAPTSNREYWQRIPIILRRDANLRGYLIAQFFIAMSGMSWGFVAVYASETWALSDGRVGLFTTAVMVGQSIFNLLFGLLGDRKGYLVVLVSSVGLSIAALLTAAYAPGPDWFFLVFGLRGASMAGFFLSTLIAYEFSAAEIRPTYIGMNNTWQGILNAISPLVGGLLAELTGYRVLFLVSIGMAFLGLALIRLLVREPRHEKVFGLES